MSPTQHHARGRALVLSACAAGGLLLTAMPAAAGQAPDANPTERASALVNPAIVYVEAQWSAFVIDQYGDAFNGGQPFEFTMRCTGFGVNPNGYIATAGHCVDPGPEGIRAEMIAAAAEQAYTSSPTMDINEVMEYGNANWRVEGQEQGSDPEAQVMIQGSNADAGEESTAPKPARVVDFQPLSEGDVALLKTDATNQPSIELAPDSDVQIGTEVLSVGYPASTDDVTDVSPEPTNKDGQVSAKKTMGSVPVYETSAALSEGMSGGPTVDMQGKVIGVNSFKPAEESQAFNFIAPASGLTELLGRNGVTAQLGENDKLFRQGLNDYFAGYYTDAMASFDKLAKLDPSFTQAEEFSSRALADRERLGDVERPGGFPVLPVAIGGGAALLIAAAVTAMLLMRRRRGSGGPGDGQSYPAGPQPTGGQDAAHMGPVSPPLGIPRQEAGYPRHANPMHEATMATAPAHQPVTGPPSNPIPVQSTPQTPTNGIPRMEHPIPSISGSDLNAGSSGTEATAVRERVSTTGDEHPPATRFYPPASPPPPSTESLRDRFCPSCGSRHQVGARFCPSCGSNVS